MSLLLQLFFFGLTLVALIGLTRWITRQVQLVGLRLTGNERVALLGYYLLMLPGIVLHELSHVAVARLLRLKVGKFSLGPKLRGRYVELGSVRVSSGGALRDSLVGLAPFLSGTAVLLLVGTWVFDVSRLGLAWQNAGWVGTVDWGVNAILTAPDVWLWAYVMFAASNAMIPSQSDRQPWLIAGIYLALALLITYSLTSLPLLGDAPLLGNLAPITDAIALKAAGTLQLMTFAFILTLVLDLLAGTALWVVEALIIELQRRRTG